MTNSETNNELNIIFKIFIWYYIFCNHTNELTTVETEYEICSNINLLTES